MVPLDPFRMVSGATPPITLVVGSLAVVMGPAGTCTSNVSWPQEGWMDSLIMVYHALLPHLLSPAGLDMAVVLKQRFFGVDT